MDGSMNFYAFPASCQMKAHTRAKIKMHSTSDSVSQEQEPSTDNAMMNNSGSQTLIHFATKEQNWLNLETIIYLSMFYLSLWVCACHLCWSYSNSIRLFVVQCTPGSAPQNLFQRDTLWSPRPTSCPHHLSTEQKAATQFGTMTNPIWANMGGKDWA